MYIVHCVIVLKHTRLREYINSLFQAQILACQASTNPHPRPASLRLHRDNHRCSGKDLFLKIQRPHFPLGRRLRRVRTQEQRVQNCRFDSPPSAFISAAPVASPTAAPGAGKPDPRCGLSLVLERHRRGTFAVLAAPGRSQSEGACGPRVYHLTAKIWF